MALTCKSDEYETNRKSRNGEDCLVALSSVNVTAFPFGIREVSCGRYGNIYCLSRSFRRILNILLPTPEMLRPICNRHIDYNNPYRRTDIYALNIFATDDIADWENL